MREDWSNTQAKFRHIAATMGVRRIAKELPAHHATVYRLIRGDTQQPTHAMRAAITRIVKQHENRKQ